MGEDFAPNFKEIFHCTVRGADIVEARLNAWSALDQAIGILPKEQWKLSQMQHDISVEIKEVEGVETQIAFIVCEAIWEFDADGDFDGGKHANLLGPEPIDPDGIAQEQPELHLVEN